MKDIIKGLREFQTSYVSAHWELLEQLSHGQKPKVLFITCSDSRIDPCLITQADLGELFVIRNAGNIIPPYGAANGGEGATVEYAIHALGIEQIIVCGHSHCGAMKGLLQLNKLQEEMPLVYDWLKHTEATRRLVKESYGSYDKEQLLEVMIAENVLTQIENLQTYPVIHSRLYQGKLRIYAWIYMIETGEVMAYDPETHCYIPPQSQIQETSSGAAVPERYFTTLEASPVACQLNPKYPQPAALSPTPTHTTSSNGDRPAAENRPAASQEATSSMPWLSPEQAERIYRGTARRR
ncbi:carbonic anhydrase [Kovacikia minuta CCNUW1]|uniref:carbonic anhydrase n=1 Tax=Kovacikia minuta TaxID=2931930 RepID=UPI001CCD53A0|nr:carbonic anhydrase [Kovacikia minuta]UBF28216.1 carbonic anhydrase [Kovacikia minuta CCNUW1]